MTHDQNNVLRPKEHVAMQIKHAWAPVIYFLYELIKKKSLEVF